MADLNAQPRATLGKEFSRKLRNQKIIPAVIYGKGIENKFIQVNELEVEKILKTKLGKNTYINLNVDGDKSYGTLVKATQGNAITRQLTHIDFWVIDENREVEVNIPTRWEGKAVGLLKGGVLEHIHHKVKLLCKANKIPAELVVDVTNLDVGQNIHLADIDLPEGVTRKESYSPTIVALIEERKAAKALEDALVTSADAPESAEGTEGAEGEAPAEGAEGAAPAADAKPAEAKADDKK